MVEKRRFLFLVFLLIWTACVPNYYKEFLPEIESQFNISFDYPSNWEFDCFKEEGYEYFSILRPSNYVLFLKSYLYIAVKLDQVNLTAYDAIQNHLSAIRTIPERRGDRFTTLADLELEIGGMKSYKVVTREQNILDFPGISRICTDISILDEDKYYSIIFCVNEADLNSAFMDDVKHLLDSIKKVR